MRNASQIRNRHFKEFSLLAPEEQLCWALSMGYALRKLMSKDSLRHSERLRNGWKKYLSRSKNPLKNA